MTLTQLEYIVAVEKFGNFSTAAKSCFVTQPTLSMQIQKIEEELGVMIFDRSKQPIQATSIGRKILDQSRVVLSQSALIKELISKEKDAIEGDLRLAIIPTLAPYLLPLFLNDFAKNFPQVSLYVEESKTDDIIQALQQNQLDIGLVVTPLEEPLLREYPLFHEPFYVYASKDSELAHKKSIAEGDLQDQELLLLTEGHCMREQMLKVCRNRNTRHSNSLSKVQFESGSIETLCHLVERGNGYTVIPHLAKNWQDYRDGKVIPFISPSPSREVSLVVHRSFARESMLMALANCIKAALPKELQNPTENYTTVGIR
ncbi:MAG: hydrogen peroxide-inducible genes activator [Proteobacteria bacterium]|nr:MAG: hydrogen peroxide-inducible genes activator [Pseudomonadota bacterium]